MSNLTMMQRINQDALEQLNAGNIPWVTDVSDGFQFAYNGTNGRRYNLLNQFILGKGGAWYSKAALNAYNEQHHLEGDARVWFNAGEKPRWVKMWFSERRDRPDHTDDDEQDDEQPEDDRVFMRTFPVWHESQLRNMPRRDTATHAESNLKRVLNRFADANNIDLNFDVFSLYGQAGVFDPSGDEITLPFDESNHDTLLSHELAHATGMPSRLHRFEADHEPMKRGAVQDLEELTAELAAAMLCARFCAAFYIENRAEYIRQWVAFMTANPTAYSKACTRAEKAVRMIAPDAFPDVLISVTAPEQAVPASEPTVACEHCGSLVLESLILHPFNHNICPDCMPSICFCDECGTMMERSAAVQHFEKNFCPDCNERLFPRFNGRYLHLHHGCSFHGNSNRYMGMEIETSPDLQRPDAYNIDRANGELMYKSGSYDGSPLWHTTTDCTINNRLGIGLEVVSHPADIDWWMSNTAIDDFSEIMKRNGFISHDSVDEYGVPKTGLHIHINREWLTPSNCQASVQFEQDYTAAKLLVLLHALQNEEYRNGMSTLERFARRKYTRYCQKITIASYDRTRQLLTGVDRRSIVGGLHEWIAEHDRYYVANFHNDNTVEIRVFRGTTNPETIKATLQFVNNLVEFARHHDIGTCRVATIREIINHKHFAELDAYAAKRGL